MSRPRINGRTPLFIVVNGACAGAARVQREIGDVLRAARRQHYFFTVTDGNDEAEFRRAAHIAARHDGAVIVVGDDAAINSGINATLPTARPFGVVPFGDVRCLSRLPDVPLEPAYAIAALLTAEVTPQRIGWVNGCSFLVSAGVGLHPEAFEQRAAHGGRARRCLRALNDLWHSSRRFELELRRGDELQVVQTSTLVVANAPPERDGNGRQQPELAAVIARPLATSALRWLALRGALDELASEQNARELGFRRLSVRPQHGQGAVRVLIDGQTRWLRPPLVFSVCQHPLQWMTPVRASSAAAA